MPAAAPPPQTLKQAKRAYQKSNKGFQFTASQERAAVRRNAKDEYARKLREKGDRAKNNKRKREEKEERERQAKKVLIEKGHLSEDALLPKVRSSQPRLNAFLRHPAKSVKEPLRPLPQHDEEDETVEAVSDNEQTLVNGNQPPAPTPPKMDEADLEFFSTAPSGEEQTAAREGISRAGMVAQPTHAVNIGPQPQPAPEIGERELEAQLGCRLSQAMLDFDIFEDLLSDTEQDRIATSSPLKRKHSDEAFETPSKCARSALSDLSPGRVYLRSQEKPDMTSAPSLVARMLSPTRNGPTSSQLAQDTLAMISTQDLDDDLEFSDAKENTDPICDTSPRRQPTGCSRDSSGCHGHKSSSKMQQTKMYDFDDKTIDQMLDQEDDEDEDYDDDLTEAEWAGLSTQPPKNTAVSFLGSPKKAKATSFASFTSMAPPPRPSPVSDLITKLKAATPKKALHYSGAPSASRSFEFDDGISDADLVDLDMQLPKDANTTLSPRKRRASPSPIHHNITSASQSFGLDDGMDAELLALVEETDVAGSSASKRARRGRTLPWENRPVGWNDMKADREEGGSQRSV